MKFKVLPAGKISGQVDLPASKSYSIRAFFVAACGGESCLLGVSDCDDAQAALQVARAFGAVIRSCPGGFLVRAANPGTLPARVNVDVRESGTSLRFVLPLLSFHAGCADVRGRGTLVGRPNAPLLKTLSAHGMDICGEGVKGSVPITYSGGKFRGGRVVVDGAISSQFISALMIAAPRAAQDTRLLMQGRELVSRDYVIMTEQILRLAGIRLKRVSPREYRIPGRQIFKGLKRFAVPSDLGLAAFLLAAAALVPSRVILSGHFNGRLIQSDGAILGFLTKMGVRFTHRGNALRISGPFRLKGGTFSLKDCPDLVPIMAVLAMFADGPVRLKDIGHARVKESDRISDLRQELLKAGADITETPNALLIRPKSSYIGGIELDPHHDHRLAMAFAVLGLRVGVTIRDMECCAKSYPSFVRDLRSLIQA